MRRARREREWDREREKGRGRERESPHTYRSDSMYTDTGHRIGTRTGAHNYLTEPASAWLAGSATPRCSARKRCSTGIASASDGGVARSSSADAHSPGLFTHGGSAHGSARDRDWQIARREAAPDCSAAQHGRKDGELGRDRAQRPERPADHGAHAEVAHQR
jgi:hypothetical protein